MTDLSTGKSVLVLATVIGCFAILWPRIFYPMMQATFSLASPIGSEEDENQRPKPARVKGHPPGHPTATQGNRVPLRMREILEDGRADIDPLTTITMEDGRPFTRPGVRGPSNRPQTKTGGTMSIVMPVYTIGIVGFFLYTILKLVFKNKQESEEDPEIDQKGYSNTMRQLGVDPAKLSKLRQCVYNSGQSCHDIDDYTEILNKNRSKRKDPKPKPSRADLGKTKPDTKPAKKNPFQGLKKKEDKDDLSEDDEAYQNLWETEERVKELLQQVEKQKLELANKHHQSKATRAKKMREVQDELRQKLKDLTPPDLVENDCNECVEPKDTDDDEAESIEEYPKPRTTIEEGQAASSEDLSNHDPEGHSEDEWEDHDEEVLEDDSDFLEEDTSVNEEDKILQILDLLIHEKVENGGVQTETTKTILQLRKELDNRRPRKPGRPSANRHTEDKKFR